MATKGTGERALVRLGGENRAVSPAVGVAMMVGLAVLLAAVIGGFTIFVGTAPDAQLSLSEAEDDDAAGNVTLHHEGGETIDLSEFSIVVDGGKTGAPLAGDLSAGESISVPTGVSDFDGDSATTHEVELRYDSSSSVVVSDTVAIAV